MKWRYTHYIIGMLTALLLVACDAHRDFPDTAMKPCHILCTDGKVLSYEDYEKSGKQAIAVVFHINQREDMEGNGYAVYLWDIEPKAFADSIGIAQRRQYQYFCHVWDNRHILAIGRKCV